jgi:glycosyltransferase involved in cell wall biosynthesis
VLGRLSRPNLDDGEIILECLLRIFRKYPNTYFLNIGASDNFKKSARNLTKVYCLPPTSDESLIDEFLKSLDIFLHYRREGETFGLNIAEAMHRGIPVVSHRSDIDNAQVELLTKHGVSGILASSATLEHYFLAIETLIADRGLRYTLGINGQTSARSCFNAQRLTDKLESIYLNALSK